VYDAELGRGLTRQPMPSFVSSSTATACLICSAESAFNAFDVAQPAGPFPLQPPGGPIWPLLLDPVECWINKCEIINMMECLTCCNIYGDCRDRDCFNTMFSEFQRCITISDPVPCQIRALAEYQKCMETSSFMRDKCGRLCEAMHWA
jgi:hypothetical protein